MVILWILYDCVFVCLALRWHKMCYECMVNSPLPESRRAIFEREKKRCVLASIKMCMSARIHALVITLVRFAYTQSKLETKTRQQTKWKADRQIHTRIWARSFTRKNTSRHVHQAHYFMSFYVHIPTTKIHMINIRWLGREPLRSVWLVFGDKRWFWFVRKPQRKIP